MNAITQPLDLLFTEDEFEEVGRNFFKLFQGGNLPTLDFAKNSKPKQCVKGFACGAGCVAKTKECQNPLEGQAKTYAGWLKIQITAGAKLSKSQQEDADAQGITKKPKKASILDIPTKVVAGTVVADQDKLAAIKAATKKPKVQPETAIEPELPPTPSSKVNWKKEVYTADEVDEKADKINKLGNVYSFDYYVDEFEENFKDPAWRKQNNAPPPPPPTATELSAIKTYTGSDYEEINKALRKGVEDPEAQEELMEISKLINSGLRQLPTYTGGNTYRGTDLSPELLSQYKVGATVADAAFSSSAKIPSAAWEANTYFVMIPKGKKTAVRDVQPYSVFDKESEALWPPSTKFKVLDVKQDYDDPESGEKKQNYIVLKEL